MATRMLIDASHAEETRVAVVSGTTLEEFDFETSLKRQIKGNIYLAKVTRVEPSLQAAFVDYGGNRQGFLAFNEIHPDYYQIPIDDRRALLAEQRAAEAARARADGHNGDGPRADHKPAEGEADADGDVETVSAEEIDEITRRPALTQSYRIQEVIKRRQIMLVQVVKEERGTKGAALTTYISLAGRYCVLMPNTARGGGISRKIQSSKARKRLRAVVGELNLPEGMAVILRTAGQERTKAEIKRDYDYLLRLWESIRAATLKSTAPALIHEEANLIKRSIRDLYRPSFEEILVEGEEGYRTAKSFMRMLMPSRASKVQPYRDPISLFRRYQIENQLIGMHSSVASLKSGGYIVIDSTEALVAIDINSGRATRGRTIEETATKTNLEAADEVARQLRLRDLAGLIVIDFIDMEDSRNNRLVERRLKEAVRSDRARIQMGRISAFGLLELSRQRLRPSLSEVSSEACPHCGGAGRIRSVESLALQALRAIEEEALRGQAEEISVALPAAAAMYLLNQKRRPLTAIEQEHDMRVAVVADDSVGPPECKITQIVARAGEGPEPGAAISVPADGVAEDDKPEARPRRSRRRRKRGEETGDRADRVERTAAAEDRGAGDGAPEEVSVEAAPLAETEDLGAACPGRDGEADGTQARRRGRRRGKRGGRRRARQAESAPASVESGDGPGAPAPVLADVNDAEPAAVSETIKPPARAPRPRRRRKAAGERAPSAEPVEAADVRASGEPPAPEPVEAAGEDQSGGTVKKSERPSSGRRRATGRTGRKKAAPTDLGRDSLVAAAASAPEIEPENEIPGYGAGSGDREPAPVAPPAEGEGEPPRRRGWWQRVTGS